MAIRSSPASPPWGVRLFNLAGRGASLLGFRPKLNAHEILERAAHRIGLNDFGDEEFLPWLELLAQDYNESARLSSIGIWSVRRMLQRAAENRLHLARYWKIHPERLQTPLAAPIYVVGLPRTGTTLLYNLLCCDPTARPLLFWEAMLPAPLKPEWNSESHHARLRQTQTLTASLNYAAPGLKQIHELRADGPEECGWLLNNTYYSQMYTLHGRIPNYLAAMWSAPADQVLSAYVYYARTLQSLQDQMTGRHWVLKSPVHRGNLAPLLQCVPNARVLCTHRDLKQVIPSCCSLIATLQSVQTERQDLSVVGKEVLNQLAVTEERAAGAGQQFADQILDVWYEEMVQNPMEGIARIYTQLELPLTAEFERNMHAWLAEHPQGKFGRHRYSLEQFGLTPEIVDERFSSLRRSRSVLQTAGS